MNFPKTRKARAATAIGIAATSALMIVGPGSAAATAGRLIGSAAIKNNSIRSIDIHNNTITGKDVKDGSLSAKDFSGTLRGATGPRGPAGASGAGTETIAAWHVAHQADSTTNTVTLTSSYKVPAGTQVEAVKLSGTGTSAWSSCPITGNLAVSAGSGHQIAIMYWDNANSTWGPAALSGGGALPSTPTALTFSASCIGGGPFGGQPTIVPSFSATVTLALTKRDTTATTTIN